MAQIRFSNGTVVDFNGVPTKEDIEEIADKIEMQKIPDNRSLFKKIGGDIKKSFGERTERLSEGYLRDIEGKQTTRESVLQTAGEGVGFAFDALMSGLGRTASALTPDTAEEKIKEGATFAGGLIGSGIDRLSDSWVVDKLSETMPFQKVAEDLNYLQQNDPDEYERLKDNLRAGVEVASIIPVGKTAQVGKRLTKEAVEEGTEAVVKGVTRGLKAVEPAAAIAKRGIQEVAPLAEKTTKFGLSQVSGLSRETLDQVLKNPEYFTKNMMNSMTRESLSKQIKKTIDSKLDDLKTLGSEYNPIRQSKTIVEVPDNVFLSPLKKYGLKIDDNGILTYAVSKAEASPFKQGELKKIQDFLETYGNAKHTANSALNARAKLADMADYDKILKSKSRSFTNLAKEIRSNLNKVIQDEKKGIQGLKKIDDAYGKEVSILNQIKKDYYKAGTNDFKDNAITKLANLTKKGREQVLDRLKQIDPNVEFKINILKAIEDIQSAKGIKVGTYTRSALAGGGLLTGNVPLVLSAIISQPELLVPILRQWAKIKNIAKGSIRKNFEILKNIENKIANGIVLVKEEKEFIDEAIDNFAKKIKDKAKPGLTIRDVSKDKLTDVSRKQTYLSPDEIGDIQKEATKRLDSKGDVKLKKKTSLFHGSQNEFKELKINESNSKYGNQLGDGVYFTESEEIATSYGKNIFSLDKDNLKILDGEKKLTDKEIENIVSKLPDNVKKYDVELSLKAGSGGPYGKKLYSAVEFYGGTKKDVNEALKELGYNAIKAESPDKSVGLVTNVFDESMLRKANKSNK